MKNMVRTAPQNRVFKTTGGSGAGPSEVLDYCCGFTGQNRTFLIRPAVVNDLHVCGHGSGSDPHVLLGLPVFLAEVL